MKTNTINRRVFINSAGLAAAGVTSEAVLAAQPTGAQDVKDFATVDVLVCGGGPSGIAAAVLAARTGAKVMLIERYGRLGGMASLAMVHPMMGEVDSPLVTELTERVGGKGVNFETIDIKYADILQEAEVDVLLHSWVCGAVVEGNRVCGARFVCKQGMMQIRSAVTIDATGDGDIAVSAGAEFEQGRPGDGLLQPMSIMYRVSGVAEGGLLCGSEQRAAVLKIGSKTWAQIVSEGQKSGELSETISVIRTYGCPRKGDRGINATQVNGLDGTKVRDLTKAELQGRKQAQQVLLFLKKNAPGYENAYISGMPAVIGVRETRRILGVDYLTRQDLITGRRREDAVVRAASFPIDIHNPAGGGQAEGVAARVQPYDIPYGCLVPKKLDNLLMAGRCISGSHDAHASYRVQCIAMAIGSAAGAAAALAVRDKVLPRKIKPADIRNAIGLKT